MSDAKSCPLHGGTKVKCEAHPDIPDIWEQNVTPCHFYNPDTQKCIVSDISDNIRDIPTALAFLSLELRQPMKPSIEFTDFWQYLDEINLDKEVIYRSIVRGYIEKPRDETITYVYASYIAADQIIRLKCPCGDLRVATTVIDAIEQTCVDALLEFRSGAMKE